jgi:hypothetical protein
VRFAAIAHSRSGTLLPRAHAAACPQLAKADLALSSLHVRECQRIAALDAKVDALQRQALAQRLHSAEGDMRALNNGAGFDPSATSARNFCCDAQRRSGATVW